MSEPQDRSYQSFQDETGQRAGWRRFLAVEAGTTLGAHLSFVDKLTAAGHREASSPQDCDYCIVFCPIVSRLGSDVASALRKKPPGVHTIMVVMHHTPQQNRFVLESRDHVHDPDVHLVVDCLFHEGNMHSCPRNDEAWSAVRTHLELSKPWWSSLTRFVTSIFSYIKRHPIKSFLAFGVLVVILRVNVWRILRVNQFWLFWNKKK